MVVKSYRGLAVWQKAIELVAESYRLAARLPASERFGLAAQIRRAAVSVPANVAEGNGRFHRGEYLHHISIARGSLMELETHFEIARRLSYLEPSELTTVDELCDHVSRMLSRLRRRLQEKGIAPRAPRPRS